MMGLHMLFRHLFNAEIRLSCPPPPPTPHVGFSSHSKGSNPHPLHWKTRFSNHWTTEEVQILLIESKYNTCEMCKKLCALLPGAFRFGWVLYEETWTKSGHVVLPPSSQTASFNRNTRASGVLALQVSEQQEDGFSSGLRALWCPGAFRVSGSPSESHVALPVG